ncbi:hypothetical protein [Burkholderia sp. BCC1638]|uniref:hypothetical protein n=1 Tax=Burkholderia sp. BCC1638 TaxID=2681391 RepID=UPI001588516E|nr:hypothetical protein [Burkholderia sp. BCC1638]
MKTTHNKIATRVALYACIAATLTACGHSAPSESDAKTAVQARIGDCNYLRVSDFNKVNGIPIAENTYKVEVKYTLTLTPTSDMKDRAKALNTDRAKLSDAKQTYDAARADYHAAEAAWVEAHKHDPDTSISSPDPADPAKVIYPVELGESGARNKYMHDHSDGLNGGGTADSYAEQQERVRQEANVQIFANDLRKECQNVQLRTLGQAFHGVSASTDLTEEVQNQWDETIMMVKTDNGWQEAQ